MILIDSEGRPDDYAHCGPYGKAGGMSPDRLRICVFCAQNKGAGTGQQFLCRFRVMRPGKLPVYAKAMFKRRMLLVTPGAGQYLRNPTEEEAEGCSSRHGRRRERVILRSSCTGAMRMNDDE